MTYAVMEKQRPWDTRRREAGDTSQRRHQTTLITSNEKPKKTKEPLRLATAVSLVSDEQFSSFGPKCCPPCNCW